MRTQKGRTATLCSMPLRGWHAHSITAYARGDTPKAYLFPKSFEHKLSPPSKVFAEELASLPRRLLNTAKLRILRETTKFLRENFYKNHLSVIGEGTTIQNWIVIHLAPAAVYLTNSKLDALAWLCACVCVYA